MPRSHSVREYARRRKQSSDATSGPESNEGTTANAGELRVPAKVGDAIHIAFQFPSWILSHRRMDFTT